MEQITAAVTEAHRAIRLASVTDAIISSATDAVLLNAVESTAALLRQVETFQSRLASEVALRSRPELGHSGLAARRGTVNASALIAELTRSTRADAARLIRVGDILAMTAVAPPLTDGGPADASDHPVTPIREVPLGPLATAILDGRLDVEAADRVTRTLAPLIERVDPDLLHKAMTILGTEAATRNADDLTAMARGVRDTLDRVGVADREQYLRAQRGLKRGRVVDGLRRVSMVLDPETDAIIIGAIDQAMSPRLGGPRFSDLDELDRSRRMVDDDRSNEQIALDTLTDLVRAGVAGDDGTILGSVKPGLRVTIPLVDLMAGVDALGVERPDSDTGRRAGPAWLEGSPEPLSAATARRIMCEAGALPLVLDGAGLPLDVGQTRRLFTAAQRVALGIRDGGCMFGDCDRPASWCEAHHIDPYKPKRRGDRNGPTNLGNGILLCRRHHMILHDHGWRIIRGKSPDRSQSPGPSQSPDPSQGEFLLIPPATVDPAQTPRPMQSKAPPWLRTA